MEGADGLCPKCGSASVEFDVVAGVSACEACGTVLAELDLVQSAAFDEQGAPVGLFVAGGDTGERAGAFALQASGAGRAIQRSRRSAGEAKLKAKVREYGALLHLQPPVLDQALHLLAQAIPDLMGNWRRDNLSAAVVYAACRLNTLPLTLGDLSAATQIDVHTLGRYYCSLVRLLDLHPPLLLPTHLLPRSIVRVTAELVQQGALAAATVAAMQRDAAMLLEWMPRQLEGRHYPMASVGTAIVLAAEMNTVSLNLDHVCASLQLVRGTVEGKLSQARQRLVQLAAFLPYSSSINVKNVGSHARTIIKLSALVDSTTNGGSGAASGSVGGGTGSSLQQQQQQQPQPGAAAAAAGSVPELGAPPQQWKSGSERGGASAANEGSASPQQQQDGDSEGGGKQKRARLHGPDTAVQPAPTAPAVASQTRKRQPAGARRTIHVQGAAASQPD